MEAGLSYSSLDFAGGTHTPPVPLREAFVNDFAYYGTAPFGYNQMPWWAASGTGSDRKGGRDLPLFWNEVDLRGFRLVARDLASRNQFAMGFLGLLTAYHVHKGFGWQACLRGTRKAAYPTATNTDPLVAKAQRILDAWRDANKWPLRSREAFRRWRRDGEVFGRLSFSGWDRLPVYRPIDPELIGSPTGDTEGPDSFGIRTDPDDVEAVWAYHLFDANDPTSGTWEDADRIIHIKANVDSCIKRGVTDFLPVSEQFDGCRRLLRNMLTSTVRQAGTAWMEKIPGATLEQVRGIVPYTAGRTTPNNSTNPIDPWNGYRGYGYDPPEPPGSVKKVEGDREFMPTPAGAAASYTAALQASLRGCCVLWGLPEFATGDASNNNFASALVANSPFTRMVEGTQFEWGACWERPMAMKVLELAAEAGFLTRQELTRLDVEVTEPQVASAEPEKDAQINSTLNQAKVMSATTWQLKLGLDPQHEAANFAEEAKRSQPQQPAPTPPGGNQDAGGGDTGGLFEGVSVRENFSGTITDAAGRELHYVDGKRVAAKQDEPKPHTNHAATQAVQKAIASANLPPEKAKEYAAAANAVLSRMPQAALDRAAKHVAATAFYPDSKALGLGALATAMKAPGLSDQQLAKLNAQKTAVESGKINLGGAYITKEGGQLHLDGGMSGVSNPGVHGGGSQATHEVYAHEFGHAIDGPALQVSNSARWQEAFAKEIGPGVKAEDGSPRLTRYAQTNAQEGLAEFCRLVYGGEVALSTIEQEFPIASKFWKEARLWPS